MPTLLKKAAPKKQARKKSNKKTGSVKKSPFKDVKEFEKELTDFANKFKTTVMNQAKRISDFFEMSCYNMIIRYYERTGYKVTVENLQSGKYRYKCSTSGIQSNFSHFKALIVRDGRNYEYEIHHNLACQSFHSDDLFTTPDISVIATGSIQYTDQYYETKRRFSYVETDNLYTFCEVKQFAPFPELMFSFIGIVHELMYPVLEGPTLSFYETPHIAPCLMISGKPGKQPLAIKASLESRYCVNILYDLFYSSTVTFATGAGSMIRMIGNLPKDDLPF